MCRSIKTLRRPDEAATTGELEAAARQYVRKISGYQKPSVRNAEAFDGAIAEIAAVTNRLLETLGVEVEEGPDRGSRAAPESPDRRPRGRCPTAGMASAPDVVARYAAGMHPTTERPGEAAAPTSPWWVRPGLDIDDDGGLRIVGEDAEALAREHGTPLFVYDRARFAENARRLQAALAGTGLPFRVRFALKANPLPEILQVFRGLGAPGTPESVGIDACSPGEVERAMSAAGDPTRSVHGHERLGSRPRRPAGPRDPLNLDAISQIERYGRRAPGTAIGIRIDPGAGAGYNEHLEYSGARPTKFGIGLERLDDAIAAAARHGLAVDTVHFHAGSGWLADGLAGFERALPPAVEAVERLRAAGHPVAEVNVGGGLARRRGRRSRRSTSTRMPPSDASLGPLGVTIACEPGDQLSKDGAILLGEVVTVERRRGVTFVGLESAGT